MLCSSKLNWYCVYFSYASGSNCSDRVHAEMYKVDVVPFRCEIDLMPSSHELRVRDLFCVKSVFDPASGTSLKLFDSELNILWVYSTTFLPHVITV